ncbi:MAG: hypothetical protein K0M49_06570 [Arenimonas sp.]|nr:hypothetical protein [Arenimonas sp.]
MKHIIVCGHYGCGGIRAVVGGRSLGLIEHWLQPIRVLARSQFDCRECWSEPEPDCLCEASVAAQVERLARILTLQAACGSDKEVSLHGWTYGLQDGLLSNLSCTVSRGRQSVS